MGNQVYTLFLSLLVDLKKCGVNVMVCKLWLTYTFEQIHKGRLRPVLALHFNIVENSRPSFASGYRESRESCQQQPVSQRFMFSIVHWNTRIIQHAALVYILKLVLFGNRYVYMRFERITSFTVPWMPFLLAPPHCRWLLPAWKPAGDSFLQGNQLFCISDRNKPLLSFLNRLVVFWA